MSDSEAEAASLTSSGTLEAFSADQISQILKDSAQDAIKTKDYLSYSTVLDIHLSEPARFSLEEREMLLQQLLETLSSDEELVFEVGWDIPALVIPFVDSHFTFEKGIRDAPGVYKVLKIFEVLALHGNAKELFLKSTEILSTLKRDSNAENLEVAEKFYEVKLYCIFELITSSMRRIHTLYPSRFLSMVVSSFINNLFNNPLEHPSDLVFVMKRMYSFARSYVSPPKPERPEISAEDLIKIEEDENFLSRKLLTALLTEGVFMSMRYEWVGFAVSYFNHLHKTLSSNQKATSDYVLDIPVLLRLNELALSFDLQPHRDFEDFVISSSKLVDFDAALRSDDDSFSSKLFEELVIDYQNNFSNCIVNNKTGSVADALGGNLLLYTYDISSRNATDAFEISLKQAIAVCIRVILPGIVHRSLFHRGLVDMSIFWCWYAVQALSKSPKKLELELSAIPKAVMSTFLQALLFAVVSTRSSSQFRYSTLTLLTKILSAAPENVAYSFIISALRECPFNGAKPVLVGVFKVLIVSDKSVDDMAANLDSMKIGDKAGEGERAPALPTRESVGRSKYITLTKPRAEDILALVQQHIDSTFEEVEGTTLVHFEHLSTLSSLLNLLIPLRQSAFIPHKELLKFATETEKCISSVEANSKNDDQNRVSINAVSVLRIALARLTE